MIVIHPGTEDLAHTRFAFSALWEAVASIKAHTKSCYFPFHMPWLRETEAAVAKLDLSAIHELTFRGGHLDFLTPPPNTPLPDFERELRQLLDTPAEVLQADIRQEFGAEPPATLTPILRDPKGTLERLADTLNSYWEVAIKPYWPRLRAVLEADVHHRGQTLALKRAEVLFATLSPSLDYHQRTIRLTTEKHHSEVTLSGDGLLLIPSVFIAPDHFCVMTSPRWQDTYQYPARGVAGLWNSDPPAAVEALEKLLGSTRARLLKHLATPTTTSQLADQFGVSPSAVSQHLSWLRRSGLVAPQRRGRSVYYELSPIGATMLEAYGELKRPPQTDLNPQDIRAA